ncbi:hypothetical protein [Halorussus salinus]|uniref:hypothetical protein n=1 Tax=Halorussus salinus TaxID=1364935 RepID=UPI001091877B|nr:hypothetical protein [Halorussus salinus]
MSETRRSVLKKGIAAATVGSAGLASVTGSASAATYDTVIRVEPKNTSTGPQNYEIEFPSAYVEGEDGSIESDTYFQSENGTIQFGGTVNFDGDRFDEISTTADPANVSVNFADEVYVLVNDEFIYY